MAKETTKPDKDKIADQEIKKIQDAQERQGLIFGADAFLPQTTVDKDLEIIELRNDTKITLRQVKDLLGAAVADYLPVFPNTNPFFKLMFKLNKWDGDPTAFLKPVPCATYIKRYIYGRFDQDLLPTLLQQVNPVISGHIKKFKLFQFLNEDGRALLESYVDDAVNVMKDSKDWFDFEDKYTKKYNLIVQLRCMDAK